MTNEKSPNWPIGFMVNPRVEVLSEIWIDRFKGVPTSWVSDSLGRSVGTMGLSTYHNQIGIQICAPAITVRVRPGDNLMIHKATEIAKKGDVIVIDGGGDLTQALIGGNVQTTAIRKGLGGFVVDGAIRDLVDWAKGTMPVWARGYTHRGPSKDGPGEVNVTIACAGMVVHPGDLILGDADGVLAVRPHELEALWPLVQKQAAKEDSLRTQNARGSSDPDRFNSILRSKGCPV